MNLVEQLRSKLSLTESKVSVRVSGGKGSYTNLSVSVDQKSVSAVSGSKTVLELIGYSEVAGSAADVSIRQGDGTYTSCDVQKQRKTFTGTEYRVTDSDGSIIADITIR